MSADQLEEPQYISLKINVFNGHNVEFTAGKTETIFDLKQTLKEVPSTQTFTSYKLTHGGKVLADSVSLEQFDTNKISMDLIPSAYTETSARAHVNIIRKISALDLSSSALSQIVGEASGSSSWESLNLAPIKENEPEPESEESKDSEEKKESASQQKEAPELTAEEKEEASAIINDILNAKENATPFVSKKTQYLKPALRSLALSAWNPVNVSRRVKGDLFYLSIRTLEGEVINVTANVTGFFVNNSSESRFDGSIKTTLKVNKDFSLLQLLKSISPKFEEQILANDDNFRQLSPELLINPENALLSNPWLVASSPATPDLARSQANYFQGGFDGADLHKDWNKEYQTIKDASIENASQLVKEQLFVENSSEFNINAIQGALAVVRGELEPLNPDEPAELWMYMRNGIFYSKPVDSIGHHANSGEEAPRVAAARDVAAVKLLNKYDIPGVHSLLTTVVDYCGQRIICQAPVPGIFSDPSDEFATVVEPQYGFTDGQSKLVIEESIAESFKTVGEAFGIKPHKVWTEDGETIATVYTSGFTKGLHGSDGKKYAIDLFRTTPLDIEFIEKYVDFSKDNSYPHREVTLRREAVNEWVKRETAVAIKKHTEKLEKEGGDSSEKKTIGIDPTLFSLNPDAFSLPKAPNAELAAELAADEATVRNVSEFLNKVLIPEFIDEQAKAEDQNPIDGLQLSETLHAHGINLRYLGSIATLALQKKDEFLKTREEKQAEIAKINEVEFEKENKKVEELKAKYEARYKAQKEAQEKGEPIPTFEDEKEEKEEERELSSALSTIPTASLLDSLYKLSVEEMISRGTKHYLRKLLAQTPLALASEVISHIFNSLLAFKANPEPKAASIDPLLLEVYSDVELSALNVNVKDVQAAIAKEVFLRYRFELPENWAETINPLSLWRNISLKFGIQWADKSYSFTSEELNAQIEAQKAINEKNANNEKNKKKGKKQQVAIVEVQTTTFVPEDILSIVPVVKDSVYDSTTLPRIWANIVANTNTETSAAELFPHLSELIGYVEQLYGPVHKTTALYMSRIASILSTMPQGSLFGRKAFQIFERFCGGDSYQAALSINQLVTIEVANNAPVNALKLLKRSIGQWIVAHGEAHPNVITTLNTAFIIALNNNLRSDCIAILKKIVVLSDETYGTDSEESSIFKFRLSQMLFEAGSYNEALPLANAGYEGLLKTIGLLNQNTVDARIWANRLENYIIYKKNELKKGAKQAEKERKIQATKEHQQNASLKGKTVSPNPELASKSVEDVLAFINGETTSSKKNKKKNYKK